MKHIHIPHMLDVIVEPWYQGLTEYSGLLAGIGIAAVVVVTYLLIRRFFGKKK